MIADDFDSIKKALEEIKKEKEREQAAKDSGQKANEAGGLKASQAISGTGIWGNIVWSTKPVVDQQADAQQAPQQTTP